MTSIPAIDSQVPRRVSGTGTYAAMLILWPVPVLFVYLLIFMMVLPMAIEDRHLSERGVAGSGEVVDLYLGKGKDRDGHHVVYNYTVGKHRYQGDVNVPGDRFAALHVGDRLPILYDPARPEKSIGDTDDKATAFLYRHRNFMALEIFSAFLLGPVAVGILVVQFRYRRQKRLLQWGDITSAEIVSEKTRSVRGGKVSKLTYRFSLAGQGSFTGTRDFVPLDTDGEDRRFLRRVLVETTTVVYDPANPKRHALYPLSFVKLR